MHKAYVYGVDSYSPPYNNVAYETHICRHFGPRYDALIALVSSPRYDGGFVFVGYMICLQHHHGN